MLSNKWTFSLTSLVVLIAFGLAFVVPSVNGSSSRSVRGLDYASGHDGRCVVRRSRGYY